MIPVPQIIPICIITREFAQLNQGLLTVFGVNYLLQYCNIS